MTVATFVVLSQTPWAGGVEAQAVGGPSVPISLESALRLAEEQSEQIVMARAAVDRADGQRMQARSELYPQIGANLTYTRTLASEFEGAFGGGSGPDSAAGPPRAACEDFILDRALPLDERIARLEAQHTCDSSPFAGFDFSDLPFGRENIYRFGLSVSQNLLAGGRISAQRRIAETALETARIGLGQAQAQLALDITQAYYDAVLSDRLLTIAEATLQQSEATLRQAVVARQVGTQPEFELLRAQVGRDNQRPVVIQRQADRELAYLRLRQLLNIPARQELHLTSDLGDAELAPVARFASRLVAAADAGATAEVDSTAIRSVVDQARQAVLAQEGLLAIAESQRRPSLVLSSQYGRVAYPEGGLPVWSDSRPNWTVGVGLSVPLFTGGRIRGDRKIAEANVLEALARLRQVSELAELDTRSAQQELAAALATWESSTGTVEQARRAHQIGEVRYREGISTQVELSDARILLQQAEANRAMAARNLQIARARVALLPHLPLGSGQAGARPGPPAGPEQQPRQAVPRQQAADATQTLAPGMGGL